jgi:hypothetical protein
MSSNRRAIAFGRYPCCNAVRPLPIPKYERLPVHESCPSCGTRIIRAFNGTLHVMALTEAARQHRDETFSAVKTWHGTDKAGPVFLTGRQRRIS